MAFLKSWKPKEKIFRTSFSFSNQTLSYIHDLAKVFKKKYSVILAEIADKVFNDEKLQKDFAKYAEYFIKMKGKDDSAKSNFSNTYYIPEPLIKAIDTRIFEFGFNDRSFFYRVLISFFHDRYCSGKYDQDIELASKFLTNKGYIVRDSGVIEDKMWIMYEKPVIPESE